MATTEQHPEFLGNQADLEEFCKLIQSPPRSEAREHALKGWELYKLARQAGAVTRKKRAKGKQGTWRKGDYVKSLTARAIDLRGGFFEDVIVGYADLRGVMFDGALFANKNIGWMALKGAKLENASLRGARFQNARLMEADLRAADLEGAELAGADLMGADLANANLQRANLEGANLQLANLVGADLRGANLCGSQVYGVSAWDVQVDDDRTLQRDLLVTRGEPAITVDNIEVAQFVYLLLNNPKIRGALDAVCRKGVLILGRFTPERKMVLDRLRDELRRRDFVPVVFDFEKPTERDITETVKTLAGLSRFIIADITNPKSSPLELQATVPDYAIPFVPIIAEGENPFAMFADLWKKYAWVLDPLEYRTVDELIEVLQQAIIEPALQKHVELLEVKARGIRVRRAWEFQGE